MGRARRDRLAYLAQTSALAVVYLILARLGLRIHAISAFAALVWAPTGVSLAAVLLLGNRCWPGIAAGALLANYLTGAPLPVALGIAAGNTLEALVGAYALRRIRGFRTSLDRLADVLGLIFLAAVGSSIVSATIGVSSLLLGNVINPSAFGITWRAWWLGDAIGDLIVAPLLLTLPRLRERPIRLRRLAESVILGLLLALASFFLFEHTRDGMAALLSPLLVWAAIRFEQRGAARATFLVSTIAIWATVRGHGPFVRGSVEEGLFLLQAFMAVTAPTFLVLGAVTSERRRAAEERRIAEEVTRDSEERYRTLSEAVDQLLWINDAEGRMIFANRQWEERLGRPDLMHGTAWADLVWPGDRDRVLELRRRAITSGERYEVELRLRMKDGEYRWMLARVVPVKDVAGRVASWLGAAADVHALKTAEEDLRRAKENAEAANRAKDQFLAALSHELRTPLTPVLALASMLEQDPNLGDVTRRQIETIRRNAELEARLIDDLLDLTRVARGKLQIHPEPVDLSEAVDHVLDICRSEAAEKGVVLERDLAIGPGLVRADPARLRQVFWNLVKNGIKFTPKNGRVLVRTADAPPGRIAIEISDTGAGLDPSELSRIFRPFEQAGQRPTDGLGLGLAISRAILDVHGGTLSVASDGRGRGSTFRVELARAAASEAAHRAGKTGIPGERPARRRRVLLIEDHVDTLGAARELLSELSCEVVGVCTLKEALAAAEGDSFDLVLSDLGLPDGSGLDLMRQLRERHGLSGIAVTGYGMEQDLRETREAGFVDHLVKPITFQRLSAAIEQFFSGETRA